jgi:hypothetical protein
MIYTPVRGATATKEGGASASLLQKLPASPVSNLGRLINKLKGFFCRFPVLTKVAILDASASGELI